MVWSPVIAEEKGTTMTCIELMENLKRIIDAVPEAKDWDVCTGTEYDPPYETDDVVDTIAHFPSTGRNSGFVMLFTV